MIMQKNWALALGLIGLCMSFNPSAALAAEAMPPMNTKAHKVSGLPQDNVLGIPSVPYKVIVNYNNTRAFASSKLKIIDHHGRKVLVLPLPKQASNVQLALPDGRATLVAWQTEKAMPYKPQGFMEKQRITYESMAHSLGGALTSLHAQYDALLEPIAKLPPQEAAEAMKKAQPTLALIGTRMHSAQRELDMANARAELFKDGIPLSQQLVIGIDTDLAIGQLVRVEYSYTLAGSFWRPTYIIDANSSANTINFKLMAQITQNSDLDWDNTEIQLSTASGTDQNPPSVQPWVVRERAEMAMYSAEAPRAMVAKRGLADNAIGSFVDDSTLAVWTLKKNMPVPEGETTFILEEQNLNTPLERMARPSSYGGGNKVWLSAAYDLKGKFMPAGDISYLLDGVPVGQGIFETKKDSMSLYFGVDPLVSVEIKKDIRKSDVEGLISKENTWNYNWTYTVVNKRPQELNVRIEEPQTQLSHKTMSVIYKDSLPATKGPDETFIWKLEVPAKGQSVLTRAITIKAPKDMPVNPGR